MAQYTLAVEGMVCSMCESHINDVVRRALPVKKVTSSHTKGQTVILSEAKLDEAALRKTIAARNTGSYRSGPCPIKRRACSLLESTVKRYV